MVQLNLLIERLYDAGIDFVIVGGFAGVLHGSTLVTRVLSVEGLIQAKEAMGRDKDLIAVKELRAIVENKGVGSK